MTTEVSHADLDRLRDDLRCLDERVAEMGERVAKLEATGAVTEKRDATRLVVIGLAVSVLASLLGAGLTVVQLVK